MVPQCRIRNIFLTLTLHFSSTKLIRKRTLAIERVKKYLSETIEDHKATFDGENVRDFIDLYLKAAQDGDDTDLFTGANKI